MDLRVGDIIEIPKDQYGRPVYRFNPASQKPTGVLQQFVVIDSGSTGDGWGTVRLRIADAPCPALRGVLYKER